MKKRKCKKKRVNKRKTKIIMGGEEVLTYTQGVGWHEKETKAETSVHSALKSAYYEAYHDARKALNTGTNVEITNENVVVQSNFDMKA